MNMALYRQSQGEIFSASQRVIFNVFGLLNEAFGDGIMNAIDLSMDTVRTPEPKGDRVNVVLSRKFLPYKQY